MLSIRGAARTSRSILHRLAPSAFAALCLLGCSDITPPRDASQLHVSADVASESQAFVQRQHVVVFHAAQGIPADFSKRVELLGGTLAASLDSIGVAVVSGLSDDSAAALATMSDVAFVEPDTMASVISEEEAVAEADVTSPVSEELTAPADVTATGGSPADALLFARQWNMRAIGADRAWAAGFRGSRTVTVAIMDTGIDYEQPELVGLVDLSRSRSFVPAEDAVVQALYPGRNPVTDLFYHGTGVAETVVSHGALLAGVTQEVTLIAVKIANRNGGFSTATLLQGLMYAADQGADVLNVSGDVRLKRHANAGMIAAFERAYAYTWRKGMLIVSVPGNNAHDFQHDDGAVSTCAIGNSMCASATGPTADAPLNGPWVNVDAIAPYTGFGIGTVDVAAPGGTAFVNTRIWLPCLTTPSSSSPASCRPRSINNGTCANPAAGTCLLQGVGTSWAAPHITGLAALLVEQNGHGKPAQIRAAILQSADDLGDPGVDPYYGHGRINVPRALGLPDGR
ncbi:MAG TPA: S8 family serine peptidase [Gemmatimonadaceae bacterium]|nr:S8 family serine peptidase [Gemmatimonadaceae bacterium]